MDIGDFKGGVWYHGAYKPRVLEFGCVPVDGVLVGLSSNQINIVTCNVLLNCFRVFFLAIYHSKSQIVKLLQCT